MIPEAPSLLPAPDAGRSLNRDNSPLPPTPALGPASRQPDPWEAPASSCKALSFLEQPLRGASAWFFPGHIRPRSQSNREWIPAVGMQLWSASGSRKALRPEGLQWGWGGWRARARNSQACAGHPPRGTGLFFSDPLTPIPEASASNEVETCVLELLFFLLGRHPNYLKVNFKKRVKTNSSPRNHRRQPGWSRLKPYFPRNPLSSLLLSS